MKKYIKKINLSLLLILIISCLVILSIELFGADVILGWILKSVSYTLITVVFVFLVIVNYGNSKDVNGGVSDITDIKYYFKPLSYFCMAFAVVAIFQIGAATSFNKEINTILLTSGFTLFCSLIISAVLIFKEYDKCIDRIYPNLRKH